MNVGQVLTQTTHQLKRHPVGIENPRLEAELLVSHVLDCERVDLYRRSHETVYSNQVRALENICQKRIEGMSVAALRGSKEFMGHFFALLPGVFVPRPETELLVEKVIEEMNRPPGWILDLGCGSGCLGLSLLARFPTAKLLSVDISEAALRTTRLNASFLGLEDRVLLWQIDIDSELMDQLGKIPDLAEFSVVLSNPPYLDPEDLRVEKGVREFEPEKALFSDQHGLGHLRRWLKYLPDLLGPQGVFAFEMGLGQHPQVQFFLEPQASELTWHWGYDLSSTIRFVWGARK